MIFMSDYADRGTHPDRDGAPVRVFVPFTKIHPAVRYHLDSFPSFNGLTAGWTSVRMTAEDPRCRQATIYAGRPISAPAVAKPPIRKEREAEVRGASQEERITSAASGVRSA
jgi:hypothetical protein